MAMSKRQKKMIFIIGCVFSLLGYRPLEIQAKPAVMPDGAIFDAEYYAKMYPDVTQALGTAEAVLYEHYKAFGMAEGRLAVALETEVSEIVVAKDAANEKLVAERAAKYAAQMAEMVNAERSQKRIAPLTYDVGLSTIAMGRAKELVQKFSYIRPDETIASEYLEKERGTAYAGENIAVGRTMAGEVMTDWMNSPSHRENILNKKYTRIGVGYYQDEKGKNYWCQIFSSDYADFE